MSIDKEKRREYMRRHRLKPGVKEKEAARMRQYRQRPEVKERHRKFQAEWRKKHRQLALEISRRSWNKNADKLNKYRRDKYATDPDYRKQKYEAELRYKESGGRHATAVRGYPKARIRSGEYKKKNPEKIRAYVKKYRAKVLIHQEREKRKTLDDRYVVAVIKKSLDYKIKTQDIPKELIEIERIKIFTHRKLKQII